MVEMVQKLIQIKGSTGLNGSNGVNALNGLYPWFKWTTTSKGFDWFV